MNSDWFVSTVSMDTSPDFGETHTGLTSVQCLMKTLVNADADKDGDVMLWEFIEFSNRHIISMT